MDIENKLYCHRSYEAEENFDKEVRMHCFVLFKYNDSWYHFEHSNRPERGIHKYESVEKAIEEITSGFEEIGDELYKLRKDSRKEISHDEYEIKTYELKKKMLKHPNISIKHLNILKYYKDYINVKKEEKVEDENDTYTLMYLKNQIKQLNGQRNNLDKQIEVLQNRVDEILEERKTNGKQFKY